MTQLITSCAPLNLAPPASRLSRRASPITPLASLSHHTPTSPPFGSLVAGTLHARPSFIPAHPRPSHPIPALAFPPLPPFRPCPSVASHTGFLPSLVHELWRFPLCVRMAHALSPLPSHPSHAASRVRRSRRSPHVPLALLAPFSLHSLPSPPLPSPLFRRRRGTPLWRRVARGVPPARAVALPAQQPLSALLTPPHTTPRMRRSRRRRWPPSRLSSTRSPRTSCPTSSPLPS
jgi:hypothetical protein